MPKFPKRLVFKEKKHKQKAGKQQTTTPTMKLKEKDYLGVLSHLLSSKQVAHKYHLVSILGQIIHY